MAVPTSVSELPLRQKKFSCLPKKIIGITVWEKTALESAQPKLSWIPASELFPLEIDTVFQSTFNKSVTFAMLFQKALYKLLPRKKGLSMTLTCIRYV